MEWCWVGGPWRSSGRRELGGEDFLAFWDFFEAGDGGEEDGRGRRWKKNADGSGTADIGGDSCGGERRRGELGR